VIKAFQDILSRNRHLGAPMRLQVFQVYKDEVMDLLVQDYSQLGERVTVKRAGASGRVEVMCQSRQIRAVADIINQLKVAQGNRQYAAS
jgi:hypothetical protein